MEWNWHTAVNVLMTIIIAGLAGWLLFRSFRYSESPGLLIFKWGLTIVIVLVLAFKIGPMIAFRSEGDTIGGLLIAAACLGVIALLWRGSIIDSLVRPFTAIIDGGNEEPDKKPFYSIANAKRKRGEYHEAIAEVRQQLDRFPNDFEGVMLLASIQAENMSDLQAAENTLNHFCDWPKAPEKQVAAAWTTMADWHLQHGVDVDSARTSLQKITTRFPETELSLRAEQRLAHLVSTEKILLEQHDRQAIVVPEGVQNVGLRDSTEFLKAPEVEPGKLAAAHVQHLATHPHDSEVREKLAVIYAQDFKRLDLATMELLHLINEPRHSAKQIVGWLNQLANFQIELGADIETVRTTLETIVARFPDLPTVDMTRRRLVRLNSEFKGKEKTPGVTLGVYEQNIGLKYGSPRKL